MDFTLLLGFLYLLNGVSSRYPSFGIEGPVYSDDFEEGITPGSRNTSCPCGWTNRDEGRRVVGGRVSDLHEFPFAVPLIDYDKMFQFCGGTIITPYHVLTAAHCTADYVRIKPPIVVSIGDHDLRTVKDADSDMIFVQRIYQNEHYDPIATRNDISVLQLARKIIYSQTVGPACLPTYRPNIEEKQVKVIGWGKVSQHSQTSPVLKTVDLMVVPYDECVRSYASMNPYVKTQVCTWADHAGSCQGDSGGPLVWLDPDTNRYTLVGIVSFGRICASDDPTVYTDPTAFLHWIQKKISIHRQKLCHKIWK